MIILDCRDNQLKKVTIRDMLDEQNFKRGNKRGLNPLPACSLEVS